MTRRGAAAANLAGTGLNTVIVAVQAVVLMPAYVRFIPMVLLGAWLAASDLLNLSQLFDLGLTNVVTQRIGACHGRQDREGVELWFGSGTISLFVVALIIGVVGYAFSFAVGPVMKLQGADAALLESCFRFCVWAVVLYIAHLSVLALARGVQEPSVVNAGMVAGSAVGFVVAAITLFQGAGLWSAAWSVVARLVTVVVIDLAYLVIALRSQVIRRPRISMQAMKELVRVAPATASSGLAYLLTSQTEGTMVAVCLRPELVPILTFTRRAADVAGGLLSALGFSSYAGFAHLSGTKDPARTRLVYSEIGSLWTSLAVACAAGYLVVNHSLVSVWVGPSNYGGYWLSVAMAVQLVVTGCSQLRYYLYRATGSIVEGSMVQLWESIARAPLMIGLLYWIGLPGLAIGSTIAAGMGSVYAHRAILRKLGNPLPAASSNPATVWIARIFVCLIAGLLGWTWFHQKWGDVLALGFCAVGVSSVALLAIDRLQDPIRSKLSSLLQRALPMRYEGGPA